MKTGVAVSFAASGSQAEIIMKGPSKSWFGVGFGSTKMKGYAIVVDEIKAAGLYRETSQVFAVLLPVQSVGVMGDARTYENAIAIRSVNTDDFMTADWSHLPYELLARMSTRIINEVRGVNRVVYDISSKPPSTIEWE